MSPANAANPAWITVPAAESLPEKVSAEIDPIVKKIGFVPNVARLLAISPDHFVGWWRYFDELMRGPSGLTKTQREMIAVVVSAEARCPYCVAAHAAALRLRTKDSASVDRLAANYRHVDLAHQDRVMLDFAVKLTQTPEACDEDDSVRLRDVGFTDADILHIVEVTAIFNYNVRLATATGLFPNAGYHELGRTAAATAG
ncbi:peroxidase-related enzyme [Streptomyces sp. NBC_01235]|uniref:peroxidase-related enzyme n=1 Tax=Streptomyces sp. NBC_01235 TaxID=2903788 RepID=UPI002E0E1E32|nr:peroxidase-related enzyme [Streptomyces sp. NBC_01235]WSP86573.1 peroxidase-related enzyme [Streptomyces sp. NBC_01235]